MNGSSLIIDTNIALYLLSGNEWLANNLNGSHIYLSFITELELLGYKNISAAEQRNVKQFISECTIIDINDAIKKYVVEIRKAQSMKLPDSIIAATALYLEMPLFTADKEYKRISDLSLLLYSPK